MIKKHGSTYDVVSESGRRLGKGLSKSGAEKRLRQVEYFKNKGTMDDRASPTRQRQGHNRNGKC